MESGVRGKGDLIFQIIGHILLMVMSLLAILPFLLLIISSFTEEQSLLKYGYSFFPKEFSAYAYEYLFGANAANIFNAYKITILVTVLGTMISLFIGAMGGYVLSRRDYPRRKAMSFYVFFTMLFNGGLVPSYMMWTQVFHVKNSFFALLLPTLLLNGFNMMLLRGNFQSNIHPALIEAAKIDGAGEFFIFRKIVLPLSLPIMAAIGLMTGIGYWNDWTNGLYYISESRLFSLQQLLNNILNNVKALSSLSTAVSVANDMPSTSIRMAMAVVEVLPILVLYPFFQKYFVKGISLGGVKE